MHLSDKISFLGSAVEIWGKTYSNLNKNIAYTKPFQRGVLILLLSKENLKPIYYFQIRTRQEVFSKPNTFEKSAGQG